MISEPLLSRVEQFLQKADCAYSLVEGVTPELVSKVMDKYVPRAIEASQSAKEMILNNLEKSLRENQDHSMLNRWKGAAMGTAQYLLLPTQIEEVTPVYATDVVVRISRWYYTKANLWKRFSPYAGYIVRTLWGGHIENLYHNS